MISTPINEQDELNIRKHFRSGLKMFFIIQLILGGAVYFLSLLRPNEVGIFSGAIELFSLIGVALWIYWWVLVITKLWLLQRRIKNKTIFKVEEDFLLLTKDQEVLNSSQEFSDSINYLLTLQSKDLKRIRSVKVDYYFYESAIQGAAIKLIYFDVVDILVEIRIGELASSEAELINSSELNLFKIIKKYR